MLGIHRNIRRAALIAAAAVLSGSLSAQTAHAGVLYNTTSFNTFTNNSASGPATGSFTTGSVATQGGFGITGATSSTATVTTGGPDLVFSHAVGENTLAAPTYGTFTDSNPFTVVSKVTVTIPTFTGSGTNGPVFGLDVFGNVGAANLGSLVVDARDGEIFDSSGASVNDLSTGAPPLAGPFAANTAVALEIDATFNAGTVTLNYYVNNNPVPYDTETASATSYYDSALFGGVGYAVGATDAAAVADFTNYSITESTSVPEPTSLGALCVGGVLFALRRNRRPVAGI